MEQATLRELRELRGWSQVDVSARLGVHINAYVAWERGVSNPSPTNASKLNELYGKGMWKTGGIAK